jgi:hypothetical protein
MEVNFGDIIVFKNDPLLFGIIIPNGKILGEESAVVQWCERLGPNRKSEPFYLTSDQVMRIGTGFYVFRTSVIKSERDLLAFKLKHSDYNPNMDEFILNYNINHAK